MKTLNKLFPLVLIFSVVLVYYESFLGVFIFDDYIWIVDNENIKSFWTSLLYSSRPLTGLTLHFNYLVGGLKAADYWFILPVYCCCLAFFAELQDFRD